MKAIVILLADHPIYPKRVEIAKFKSSDESIAEFNRLLATREHVNGFATVSLLDVDRGIVKRYEARAKTAAPAKETDNHKIEPKKK